MYRNWYALLLAKLIEVVYFVEFCSGTPFFVRCDFIRIRPWIKPQRRVKFDSCKEMAFYIFNVFYGNPMLFNGAFFVVSETFCVRFKKCFVLSRISSKVPSQHFGNIIFFSKIFFSRFFCYFRYHFYCWLVFFSVKKINPFFLFFRSNFIINNKFSSLFYIGSLIFYGTS